MIYDLFLIVSAIFALLGAIGLFRFKDCYMRMHAATLVSIGGVMVSLLVVAAQNYGTVYFAKIILIVVFLVLTNPVSSHAILDAAHRVGISPSNLQKDELHIKKIKTRGAKK